MYYSYVGSKVISAVNDNYKKIEEWKARYDNYVQQDDSLGGNINELEVINNIVYRKPEQYFLGVKKQKEISILKENRDNSLNTNYVFINGIKFDARPSDISNIQLGIAMSQTKWINYDNEIVTVNNIILQELLDNSLLSIKNIYDEYISSIELL